ncbi:hypothetical protein lerEdw1_017336 [Lerista edwardsae]|nr:hypothetical protein lerEdw1_017336 [Lerista edwardsae]
MEGDILDALEALGYKGPLLDEEALSKAAESGLASQDFCELCIWLGSQIQPLCDLEESISSTAGGEDVESLQLEMSGFLKELACPYSTLVSGDIKDRLKKKEDCLKVLLFLSSELQTLQILRVKQHKASHSAKNNEIHQEIQMICGVLDLPKPSPSPSDIPVLLSKIESKVQWALMYLNTVLVSVVHKLQRPDFSHVQDFMTSAEVPNCDAVSGRGRGRLAARTRCDVLDHCMEV